MLRKHIKVNEFGHIIFDKLLTLCKDIHFQTLKKKKVLHICDRVKTQQKKTCTQARPTSSCWI